MSKTSAESDILDELLELEHDGWKALCGGTAAQFYGDVMAADGVMVLANGAVMTRAEVTEALAQAPPWQRYEITDALLIDVGTDTAALVYTGKGWREGADEPFVGAMSSVYHRTDTGWRLALYQQTQVIGRYPGPPKLSW
jgi:hypothetical protein